MTLVRFVRGPSYCDIHASGSAVARLGAKAMSIRLSDKTMCDAILEYRRLNNGREPRRNRQDPFEDLLGRAKSKLKTRREKAVGPHPSQRRLSREEAAYFNWCLSFESIEPARAPGPSFMLTEVPAYDTSHQRNCDDIHRFMRRHMEENPLRHAGCVQPVGASFAGNHGPPHGCKGLLDVLKSEARCSICAFLPLIKARHRLFTFLRLRCVCHQTVPLITSQCCHRCILYWHALKGDGEGCEQATRIMDSGCLYQFMVRASAVLKIHSVHGARLMIDEATGIPLGMTQEYFDEAVERHGTLGWCDGQLHL